MFRSVTRIVEILGGTPADTAKKRAGEFALFSFTAVEATDRLSSHKPPGLKAPQSTVPVFLNRVFALCGEEMITSQRLPA